jgi:hypothetical protein
MLILLNKLKRARRAFRREYTMPWLIRKLLLYLTGFWKRGIQPETRKDSQKCGGEK